MLQGNTWRKISCNKKKVSLMTYNAGKNLAPLSMSRVLRKKNSYAKTLITHNPLPHPTKGKWSTPIETRRCGSVYLGVVVLRV